MKTFKYLGITKDIILSFVNHVSILREKNTFCSLYDQLRKVLSTKQLIRVCKVFVQPIIQFGVLIKWHFKEKCYEKTG